MRRLFVDANSASEIRPHKTGACLPHLLRTRVRRLHRINQPHLTVEWTIFFVKFFLREKNRTLNGGSKLREMMELTICCRSLQEKSPDESQAMQNLIQRHKMRKKNFLHSKLDLTVK